MARRSRSPYAILGVLAGSPRTGYDINQEFRAQRRAYWQESYGQIYPSIKKLCEQGWLRRVQDEEQTALRKVYRVTGAGQEALRSWLEEPEATVSLRDEVALRVSFGSFAPRETTRALLERERERVGEALRDLAQEAQTECGWYEQMSRDWSRRYLEARREWVESCLRALERAQASRGEQASL